MCGSSKNFHGVQLLLDAVVDYLPSPADRPPVHGQRAQEPRKRRRSSASPTPKDPFCGPGVQDGERIDRRPGVPAHLLGRVAPEGRGAQHRRPARTERIARIFRMMGDRRDALDVAGPGEIVAVVGLKSTYTGNTLCSHDAAGHPGRDPLPGAGDLAGDHARTARPTRPSWPTRWASWSATTRR